MAIARSSSLNAKRPHSTSLLSAPKQTWGMASGGGKKPRGEKQRAIGLQHSGQFAFPIPSPCNLVTGHSVRKLRLRRGYRKPSRRNRIYSVHEPSTHRPLSFHVPTNDMPNDLKLGRGANKKTVYKHPALIDIINKVESEEKDRDRLHGLVTCAEEFKQTQNRSCKCIDIQLLGHGSWNCAYRFEFSNGDTMAALVSNYEPKAFSRTMKESEIATMRYLHSTEKYNKYIKVPEVYDWDLSHDNKAGAPYIFREVIEGKDLSREFDSLTKNQKLAVTTAIARVHKVLSQPADFEGIGGIFYSQAEKKYNTRGCASNWDRPHAYSSIEELWKEKIEHSFRPCGQPTPNQRKLQDLVDKFSPLGKLRTLCIQHIDLAIRNVVFNDKFEIAGVIDWEYAQVVPLAIAAKIPQDFTGDPELAKHYAAAYGDPSLRTCPKDFKDSINYIQFHDLIMRPDHARAKKHGFNGIEYLTRIPSPQCPPHISTILTNGAQEGELASS